MDRVVSRGAPPGAATPPSATERAEAAAGLARYFAGFGVVEGEARDRLVQRFVGEALERRRVRPRADLAELAIEAAEEALGDWFARVVDVGLIAGQPPVLVGRAAWWQAGGPGRWADALLEDPPDAALVEALRAATPPVIPAAAPGSMPAQSLDAWSLRDLVGAVRAGLRGTGLALRRRVVTS